MTSSRFLISRGAVVSHTPAALAGACLLILAACGGGGGGGSSSNGTLSLALTDAPSCGYDAVNVTVEKVRVHKSSSATDTDSGWSEVVLAQPTRLNLLTLTNGVLEELGQTALPAGKYTQLRLVLSPNDGAHPLANSVTPTGGSETALTTPSGQQSGVKTNIDIDIAADKVADFVLDFHVCESIVKRGNSGQYNLKPVITVLPRLSDAGMRIVGYVDTTLPAAATTVSAQVGGVPVRSTPPDSTGKFVLYPVPAGNYDLVINAQGRVTALVTGVPVVTTAYTYVNTTTSRINPPAATVRTVSGSVSTGLDPIDATVRALKLYAGGPTVELGAVPVNSLNGSYSFNLPAEAPLRAAYAAETTPLVFAADPTAPIGLYTLASTFTGTVKTQVVDVSAGPVTAPAFTFP